MSSCSSVYLIAEKKNIYVFWNKFIWHILLSAMQNKSINSEEIKYILWFYRYATIKSAEKLHKCMDGELPTKW